MRDVVFEERFKGTVFGDDSILDEDILQPQDFRPVKIHEFLPVDRCYHSGFLNDQRNEKAQKTEYYYKDNDEGKKNTEYMGYFYSFIMDPVKQLNQRITDDGNNSCNDDADEDLRKIPRKETNNTNDKDDKKKFVFLVQSAHN